MAGRGVERSSLVLGIGGGVASDLFGFAGAIYMRGVCYAHVATSLVAMVDAAIGGKTGVDLREGKNLAGCFRDPIAVFCGVDALETLSAEAFREGLAEIIKAAIIEGGDLFRSLGGARAASVSPLAMARATSSSDQGQDHGRGRRSARSGRARTLNLGDTFAHGVERASNYSITHGKAVALGLRAAGLLALRTGRFSRDEHLRVLTLLTLVGLPLQTSVTPDAIFTAMHSDKKKSGGRLRFVLPRAIGDVEYGVECANRTVRAVLERMALPPENVRARR